MSERISIECQKVQTDHMLNWYNSRKKWLVAAKNNTDSNIYVSWSEQFVNPFDETLWIEEIDESADAAAKYIAEPRNITSASFKTFASDEHRIAPHKFVQICIPPKQTGYWLMERQSRKDNWGGFSIYEHDLVKTIRVEKKYQPPSSTSCLE